MEATEYTVAPVAPPLPFLFDLDGTLADTLADIVASCNHVRGTHGLPALAVAEVKALVGDGARSLVQRAIAPLLPPPGADHERALDAAFADYVSHHERQCTVHAKLYPGVLAHLQALHERGHPLAVVTNKPLRFARPIVEHLGLGTMMPVVVGGDTLPLKKPDPAPLRHALRLLGCERDAGTMVGDGIQDLRAGRALGLRTIACLFGYGDPMALRAFGADGYWTAFPVSGTA